MSGELRTTTLIAGPFPKPLTPEQASLLARFFAKAMGQGFAVLRAESATHVSITAVQSVPTTPPFTRVREIVPSAVITALVGEATAPEGR